MTLELGFAALRRVASERPVPRKSLTQEALGKARAAGRAAASESKRICVEWNVWMRGQRA